MADGRDRDPKPLRDLLDTMVSGLGWRERIAVGRLRDAWADAVGEQVAARSEPLRLQRGVLLVRADGGAWATELTLLGATLAKRIDAHLGGGLVREVRVVTGESRRPEI